MQRTDWKCFTASLHNHDLSAARDPDSNLLRSSMTPSAQSHFSPSHGTPTGPAYCPNAGSQSKTKPVVLSDAKYRKAEPRTSPRKEICICSSAAERVSSLLYRRGRSPLLPLPIGAPRAAASARPAPRPGRALAPTPAKPDSRPSRLCKGLRYQRWKSPKPFVLQKELKVFQVAMLARSKQQRTKPAPAAREEERSPEGARAPTAVPPGDAPRRAGTANSCPGQNNPRCQKQTLREREFACRSTDSGLERRGREGFAPRVTERHGHGFTPRAHWTGWKPNPSIPNTRVPSGLSKTRVQRTHARVQSFGNSEFGSRSMLQLNVMELKPHFGVPRAFAGVGEEHCPATATGCSPSPRRRLFGIEVTQCCFCTFHTPAGGSALDAQPGTHSYGTGKP